MIMRTFHILNIFLLIIGCQIPATAQDFILQTDEAGFRTVTNTNGIAVTDYDLDGDLDIYFVGKSSYNPADMRTWNRLFSNQGDGNFDDVTAGSGVYLYRLKLGDDVSSVGKMFLIK
jgi:hypothetical protein